MDAIEADAVEVAHGGGQPDRRSDGLRARLEALRRRQVLGAVERHGRDHRPAREERRQRLEHRRAPVQAADAVRAEHLVSAEDREVDAERGQVERQVRRGLAGIHHRDRARRPARGR
jgi:hypothetical protein